MSPKYVLRNIALLIFSPFLLNQCSDEFNDPNPKGTWVLDDTAPQITLVSPQDSAVYKQEYLPIKFLVEDSVSIYKIQVQIASLGKPAPGFDMILKPGKRIFSMDTIYHSNVADTLELQMLVYAEDSAGNARSKSVTFWMIKP